MSLKGILDTVQKLADKFLVGKPYSVGGLPRDIYMKIPDIKTKDVDLTTNSPEILRLGILVADHLNVTFELSDDGHLTVFTDEFDLDFSSHFVSDGVVEYLNGKFQGLEEAFSRDFTINTLHQDLVTDQILDPTEQGFEDIKNKLIRTPVPASITLSDDPRRAYRAINLATRYGFQIDGEIKDFVVQNPDLFTAEKIKDKYVAVKIGQALKNNEALTLELLKEMQLFSNVPLNGYFKEVLIKNKMLAEYLAAANAIQKKSSQLLAKNWEEYASQGPAYQQVMTWWQQNSQKMPGAPDDSYESWSRWYMNKYRTDWGGKHKGPEETLEVMKNELNSRFDPMPLELHNLNTENLFNLMDQKRKRRQNKDLIDLGQVYVKPGVNIENVSPAVKAFIERVGQVAQELKLSKPIITSGWRSIEEQFSLMGKNWSDNGGMKSGRRYLTKLYGKDYGNAMADIFEQYGLGPKAQELGVQVIKAQPTGSRHITEPGQAVDLSMTSGIKKILNHIVESQEFQMKVVDETKSFGPHYHVSIFEQVGKIARIKNRKELLRKISDY